MEATGQVPRDTAVLMEEMLLKKQVMSCLTSGEILAALRVSLHKLEERTPVLKGISYKFVAMDKHEY